MRWLQRLRYVHADKRVGFGAAGMILCALIGLWPALSLFAQGDPTPIPLNLPTRTAPPTDPGEALPTLTETRVVPFLGGPTPTQISVVVEVRDKVVPGNVRQAPSLEGEVIGTIKPGEFYPVTSRSGLWLQILYGKPNPDALGWVYSEIVVVTGNLESVPMLGSGQVPTPNIPTVQAQQTSTAEAASVNSTPGGFASATSARASATGVFLRTQAGGGPEPTSGGPKPTFTPPKAFVEATLAPRGGGIVQAGLPPIFPIIILAALGIFGLLISSLRRL